MVPVAAAATIRTEVISRGLTAADWGEAGAVLVVGVVAAVLLRRALTRRFQNEEFEAQTSVVAARFAGLLVSVVAFFLALSLLGIRLGPAIGAIGIGGIAVALAAQTMLSDLIASILLQTRRPFRRGDQIASNDHEGRVEDVNFRTVVLRSFDGQRVFLPASKVLNGPIVNYTVLGRRRSRVVIGLPYDTDLEAAAALLLGALSSTPGVHDRPFPEVLVTGFGESAVEVDLLFWHLPDFATTRRTRSAVAVAAKRALDAAGVEIPFPQRVLHFTAGPQPLEADDRELRDGRR
ncbi:MAG TPA: mechanosensitive ion channel domain-containing protein [Acidimicrobiia bacterium]|nr:mechanosensitive ion channel domain-containing protein [Acidimicrobiia bacterium]